MKSYVCLFQVECIFNGVSKEEYGLIYADNFCDAMEQLENEMYGNDLIQINRMELFDTAALFTKDVYLLLQRQLSEGV